MLDSSLFKVDENGMLLGIDKGIYQAGLDLLDRLQEVNNATMSSSTQFVKDVKESDLEKLVKGSHDNDIYNQFQVKFQIIKAYDDAGDYVLLLNEDAGDYRCSKAIVVLHVTVENSSNEKLYSCLVHSLKLETRASLHNGLIGGLVSLGAGYFFGAPAAFVGLIGTFAFTWVHINKDIRKALDIHMVKMLLNSGHIVDAGTAYVLHKRPHVNFK